TTSLTITPKGWLWLAAQPAARWQELWQAWLTADAEVARPYRFSWQPFSANARQFVVAELRNVPQDRFVALPDLLPQWRLRDPIGHLPSPYPTVWVEMEEEGEEEEETGEEFDPVVAFCLGPLFWLGVVDVAYAADPTVTAAPAIRLTPHGAWLLGIQPWSAPPPATGHGTITKGAPNTIVLPVQMVPRHLAQLAQFCRWEMPTADNHPRLDMAQQLTLDAARIGQMVAKTTHPAQILEQVAAALGRPPSRRLRQRIQRWAKQGDQVRLRELLVLEAADAALLDRLQGYQLVRRRIDQTLGPHHVAVNPQEAPGLAKTLETFDLYVDVPPAAGSAAALEGDSAVATADVNLPPGMQWLLFQLYRGLGEHVPLPVPLPWDRGHALAARLTPMQRAAAERAAQLILADLHAALDGYLRLPAWLMAHFDPTATLATLQQALADNQDVEIRYWSVSSGGPTVRLVSPHRLEDRADTPYLIAYCHLRQAERVFRVDRIETVALVPRPPGGADGGSPHAS
ncbi:MAG: WYL domain-containing protein, partial [Caldilineaceae bacterium]|nr:WYL domain-containing protein [Caldilineaceae bacterium]